MGRAFAIQGDTPKARAAYQDFLTLWRDADADIPVLKQAKAGIRQTQVIPYSAKANGRLTFHPKTDFVTDYGASRSVAHGQSFHNSRKGRVADNRGVELKVGL